MDEEDGTHETELQFGHVGEEVAAEVVGVHESNKKTEGFFVGHL